MSPSPPTPRRKAAKRTTRPLTAACVTGIFVLGGLAGCGSNSNAGPTATKSNATPSTIRLQEIAIHPSKVTITRGSTVTWQWLDGHIDTAHNVTSQPGGLRFKSSATQLTGSYSIRFDTPGKYFYECTLHPASMRGEIIVN